MPIAVCGVHWDNKSRRCFVMYVCVQCSLYCLSWLELVWLHSFFTYPNVVPSIISLDSWVSCSIKPLKLCAVHMCRIYKCCWFFCNNCERSWTFLLLQNSSTYWEGKSDMESLQRVYGISFPDGKMLKEWEKFQEEAKNRDHRKIGRVSNCSVAWIILQMWGGGILFEMFLFVKGTCFVLYISEELNSYG